MHQTSCNMLAQIACAEQGFICVSYKVLQNARRIRGISKILLKPQEFQKSCLYIAKGHWLPKAGIGTHSIKGNTRSIIQNIQKLYKIYYYAAAYI